MIEKAVIIPTGDEILNGTVVDTNSPAIMGIILEKFPGCEVKREKPVIDKENDIIERLEKVLQEKPDLIILIGGTGGGHRYIPALAGDFTHSALMKALPRASYRELFGSNGHLWSRLTCGEKSGCIVANVPGPYIEATEATRALIECISNEVKDMEILVEEVSKAVRKQYSAGGHEI